MGQHLQSIRDMLEGGQPVRVLGLGDSLTYGWEVTRGFFDRFVDGLEKRYPESAITRIRAGIPGDTASGGLGRVGPLAAKQPHLATVQFGINDCFQRVTPLDFERDLRAIVGQLAVAGAKVVVCTSCSVAHLVEADAIAPFYQAIERTALELSVDYAGLHAYWDERHGIQDDLFGWDGIHPTDEGHQIMADGLLAVVAGDEQ